jgi:cytochrome c553
MDSNQSDESRYAYYEKKFPRGKECSVCLTQKPVREFHLTSVRQSERYIAGRCKRCHSYLANNNKHRNSAVESGNPEAYFNRLINRTRAKLKLYEKMRESFKRRVSNAS